MSHLAALEKDILIPRSEIDDPAGSVYSERTDRQLVDLCLTGDETAFECIFERHKRRIAVIGGRFFQNQAEVEEMIQITFTKAYLELKSFRGLYDFSLASWLNRIAVTTCLNTLKNGAWKIENLITVLSDHEMEVLAVDLRQKSTEELIVQRDLLDKLLNLLTPDDRVLLQMLHGQEMSVAEVAAIFGWSRPKVKVRAHRARRSLGKILKRFL